MKQILFILKNVHQQALILPYVANVKKIGWALGDLMKCLDDTMITNIP